MGEMQICSFPQPNADSNLNDISVLLVEDIKMMQELTSHALNCLGIKKILKATNGQDAYDLYKTHPPDIIICDWQMAPLNGLEMAKKIRRDTSSATRCVPIIMITGYASESYVKRARDAGVNEFLVKPFTAKALASRLSAVISRPKPYIESRTYFGPDRRRKSSQKIYDGPMRRNDDIEFDTVWSVNL